MLYTSILGLGIGELAPKNMIEYAYCTVYMIISAFTFSHVFGQISGLFNFLASNTEVSQKELDAMNTILANFDLSEESK